MTTIDSSALLELKQLYKKHYGVVLTDEQVNTLGTRLIELFKVVAKPIPKVDRVRRKVKNEVND